MTIIQEETMYKKVFDILSTALFVIFIITIILSYAFPTISFFKINLFVLLIVLFISFISKKNILENEHPTVQNKVLMAVMTITIIQYIFGSFFILGRLFAEHFIK